MSSLEPTREIQRINAEVVALHDSLRFREAVPLARQAVELARKHAGEHNQYLAASLANLAGVVSEMGSYAEARDLYQEALTLYSTSSLVLPYQIGQTINSFGALAEAEGDYSSAVDFYRLAFASLSRYVQPDAEELTVFLNNLGRAYELIGDFRRAERAIKRGLELREQRGDEKAIARSCSNLAELYCVLRRYAESKPLYDRALLIQERLIPPDVDGTAASLNGIGLLELRTRDYVGALRHLSQALDMWTQTRGAADPRTLGVAGNLAALYGRTNRLEDAERLLRETLASRRNRLGNYHPDVAISLYNLGLNRMQQGFPNDAFSLLSEATRIDDAILGQVLSTASERQTLEHLASIAARTDAFLSLISIHLADDRAAVTAAFESVLHRKAISVEALRAQRALSAGRDSKLGDRRERLQTLRNAISKAAIGVPDHEAEVHKADLEALEAERDDLEREVARMLPEFDLLLRTSRTSAKAVARVLPARSVLIEYVRVNTSTQQLPWGQYLVFALTAGNPNRVQMFSLGDAERIDKLVHRFRRQITEGVVSKRSRSISGESLASLLLGPMSRALRGAEVLLVSPDSELTQLPFHALPMGDALVIDRLQVGYLGCGRDLLTKSATEASSNPSLVVADPDFDLHTPGRRRPERSSARRSISWTRGRTFGRLVGTRIEGRNVARLLSVRPLTGKQALKGVVKGTVRPAVLHIATHGFFFPDQMVRPLPGEEQHVSPGPLAYLESGRVENPLLRSGLALAGANAWARGLVLPEAAEDGILTAEDVCSLDLHGTELVVLSACETGLGSVRFGSGVLGLRRAFAVAGARTTVMSLWKVPDDYTQRLMTTFYQKLRLGLAPAAALREAQLHIRQAQPNPYYWAAFICEGGTATPARVAPRDRKAHAIA